MATLTVRQLDDDIYERLRAQARANNRSLEAEARVGLTAHVRPKLDLAALVADLRAHQARMKAKYGLFSDSTDIIRQMRDDE